MLSKLLSDFCLYSKQTLSDIEIKSETEMGFIKRVIYRPVDIIGKRLKVWYTVKNLSNIMIVAMFGKFKENFA